jgi:hypothetical protein
MLPLYHSLSGVAHFAEVLHTIAPQVSRFIKTHVEARLQLAVDEAVPFMPAPFENLTRSPTRIEHLHVFFD